MNEMLRELESDLRRERLQKLWERCGRLMVAASVGVVLATIVFVVWQDHRKSVAMEKTSEVIRAIDRMEVEDHKGAIALLEEIPVNKGDSYYGIIMLQKAKAQHATGDVQAMWDTYQKLAKAPINSDNEAFVGIAKILAAGGTGYTIEPDQDSPFYYTQSEWKAWQLVEAGKKEEAVKILLALRDNEEVPASLRARVNEIIGQMAPQKDNMHEQSK